MMAGPPKVPPVPPSALERLPPENAPRAPGADYYLGDREGRSKLLVIFWVISLGMTGLGFALMVWIWMRGGL